MIIGVLTLGLTGCGPDLSGNFTGTQDRQSAGYTQRYQAQFTLAQDGDKVTGSVYSTPTATDTSTTGTTTGSYNPYPMVSAVLNGQIEGTVNGDILQNVKLNVFENGCQLQYTGSLSILDGTKLEGMLISSGASTGGEGTSTMCTGSMGVSSSHFKVSK
ncbi:MAG: hypothetical protein IT285_04345 [Bdellovibrionales bacterium]|nr:hypothetical protein [Bdellovibrionales bacterium]